MSTEKERERKRNQILMGVGIAFGAALLVTVVVLAAMHRRRGAATGSGQPQILHKINVSNLLPRKAQAIPKAQAQAQAPRRRSIAPLDPNVDYSKPRRPKSAAYGFENVSIDKMYDEYGSNVGAAPVFDEPRLKINPEERRVSMGGIGQDVIDDGWYREPKEVYRKKLEDAYFEDWAKDALNASYYYTKPDERGYGGWGHFYFNPKHPSERDSY